MSEQKQPTKALNVILWIIQILLAGSLIWAAAMKWFMPAEKLAAMWPWTAQISPMLVKLTGVADLLGGLGLILPAMLHIRPKLTPIAAIGVVLLMVCAGAFHLSRGEASVIGVNIAYALLAAFVAWGRLTKAAISER